MPSAVSTRPDGSFKPRRLPGRGFENATRALRDRRAKFPEHPVLQPSVDLTEPPLPIATFSFTDLPSWDPAVRESGRADLPELASPSTRVVTRFLLWSGLSSSAPSRTQLCNRRTVATLTRPVAGGRTIAVISAKGGVGTTSTVVNLGHVFAGFRSDPVIAWDANSSGNLAYRIPGQTRSTIVDLLADPEDVPDIHRYTGRAPSGLDVLASQPADHGGMLGPEEYRRVLELLRSHYALIMADCATAVLDGACPTVAVAADQLVVVSHPTIDATRAVSRLLTWLGTHGHGRLVNQAVLVVNAVGRRSGSVDLTKIKAHFAPRVRHVVSVPWDPHLQAGGRARLEDLQPGTRHAYLRLATAVASGFPLAGSASVDRKPGDLTRVDEQLGV